MQKFKPVHMTMNNCIEDIYQMVLKTWNVDYTWMYATSWGFGIDETAKGTIGRKIFSNRENVWRDIKTEKNLLQYTGVQIIWEKFQSINQVEQVLKKYGYVGVRADAYVCPWNAAYKKAHIEHFILLVEDKTNHFGLFDPYITQEKLVMEKSYFVEYVGEGELFYFLPERKTIQNKPSITELVKKNALEMLKTNGRRNDFDQMRRFGELVTDINEIKEEFEVSKSMQFAPIVRKMEQIMYGRTKYVEFLNKQYTKKDEPIDKAKANLIEAINDWSIIKSYIMKEQFLHFSGKQIPKFQKRLSKVILLEEETAKILARSVEE